MPVSNQRPDRLNGLINGSDDELTLLCWVLNVSDDIFIVKIRKSKTVAHLKEMIKNKKEHTFGAIEADALRLWKVSEIFPVPVDDV